MSILIYFRQFEFIALKTFAYLCNSTINLETPYYFRKLYKLLNLWFLNYS